MIIWKGWGLIPVLIAGVIVVIAVVVSDRGNNQSSLMGAFVFSLIVIGTIANWFIGRALNRSRREAGVSRFDRHSLFFIPIEWWSVPAVLYIAFMISMMIKKSV